MDGKRHINEKDDAHRICDTKFDQTALAIAEEARSQTVRGRVEIRSRQDRVIYQRGRAESDGMTRICRLLSSCPFTLKDQQPNWVMALCNAPPDQVVCPRLDICC